MFTDRLRKALHFCAVTTAIAAAVGGCDGRPKPGLVPDDRPITQPAKPRTSPATRPTSSADSAILPPSVAATQPSDYPGLHNVVAYAQDIYSGSVPEGTKGFASLKKLGVKTVLSVDGAEPELEAASEQGLRYVHLPITYSGFSDQRRLELAKAVRDLPRPIYIHCHHGKHRSAGAAGAALVSLGILDPAEGVARMRISGTAADYQGLYACTANATVIMPAVLDALQVDFKPVVKPEGKVKTMVEIEFATENLKAIQKSGWKVPANHPDLVPAAEAGRLADYYRFLLDLEGTRSYPSEYRDLMLRANQEATALEESLLKPRTPPVELDRQFTLVTSSCSDCHRRYRDQ